LKTKFSWNVYKFKLLKTLFWL